MKEDLSQVSAYEKFANIYSYADHHCMHHSLAWMSQSGSVGELLVCTDCDQVMEVED